MYRQGVGWTWEQDIEQVESAKEDLESQQKDLADYLKEEQISQLEEQRDAIEKGYQDKIDLLQDLNQYIRNWQCQ